MKKGYLAILLIVFGFTSHGQATLSANEKARRDNRAKGILYRKEFTVGGKLTSNGWAITGNFGKILNVRNTRIFEFELVGFKDPKEVKQPSYFSINYLINGYSPKDYFFGKQNDLFALRAAFGYKHNIAEKAEKSGVALSLVYVGGISLGFLKPYYLDFAQPIDTQGNNVNIIVVSEKYNADPVTGNKQKFTDFTQILGYSGFGKGFGEIKPLPGLYGKVALNFEWGAKDNFITAIEAGVTADLYYKKVPIMINDDNKLLFLSAFIGLQFGKRY